MSNLIAAELIATEIFEVRGKKVMLGKYLAKLYGVETKRLNEQVRRNINRFPADFMFQLTKEEVINLMSQSSSRSQIATLKQGQNIKYLPFVFTQEGVAMLSSVLNSDRAIQVNILIMRAFVRLKEALVSYNKLAAKINELEKKYIGHDEKMRDIFEAIRQLVASPPEKKRRITGFSRT
ncbi:MAG: ORF6N domain-containing protein [Candidatus Omnitrophica bacterium]|nr:ORF6N domain-containing protein [Candidatus Omnitrophota bacterium]